MADFIPHDKRSKFVWFDGQIVGSDDPKINVLTHGMHYNSVFEGLRGYLDEDGKVNIFLERQHTERLRDGCAKLAIKLPWTDEEIDKACNDVIAANGHGDCYIRPIVYLGSEDLRVEGHLASSHLAIAAFPLPSVAAKEVKLIISKTKRAPAECLPVDTKSSAMFQAGRAGLIEARAAGFDDAVFLDLNGNFADCSASNIFFLMDGKLHTPTAACILPGITQKAFFKIAEELGIEVVVRDIKPAELTNVDAAFLCGTAAEAKPVIQIDAYKFDLNETIHTLIETFDRVKRMTPDEVDEYFEISGGTGL